MGILEIGKPKLVTGEFFGWHGQRDQSKLVNLLKTLRHSGKKSAYALGKDALKNPD